MFNSLRRNLRIRIELARASRRERRGVDQAPDGLQVPPAKLRYRVHGALDAESFLRVGEQCSQDIENLLRLLNRDLSSFERVLDFGCGCGRVLRYLRGDHASCRFYGTDIDPQAISWCRAHLSGLAQWEVNDHAPPTRYDGGTFDLVYAISVFTHLDEARQFAWLAELKRIAKVGALVILTVHGSAYIGSVAMPERGFLYRKSRRGALRLRDLPDYYQTAYHTRQYIEREWARLFRIRHYLERGMNGHQDAVILANDA